MESSQPISNVTTNMLPKLITEQTNVLGDIKVQLQALKLQPMGWVPRELADDTDITV